MTQREFIDLDTARAVLYDRIWKWRGLLYDAFEVSRGLDSRILFSASASTMAGLVCDLAYELITQNAAQDDDVVVGVFRGQRYWWVEAGEASICLRVKKVDKNFLSWNYPTRQSVAWNQQGMLAEFHTGTRLEIGYRTDATGSVLSEIFVLCRLSDTIQWLWQIYGERVSTFAVQPLLLSDNPAATVAQRRFLYEPDQTLLREA